MIKTKVTRGLVLGILVLLASFLGGYHVLSMQLGPVDPDNTSIIEVRIAENSTASQVAELLCQEQLIRSQDLFLAYCRYNHLDSKLKAGHYRFSPSQSLAEIAEAIAAGRVVTISFTIPEGYTVDAIGRFLADNEICTPEDWQEAINAPYDYQFLQMADPGPGKSYLEGFLFPDTYVIAEGTTAVEIVKIMLENFHQIWEGEFTQQASAKGVSVYDVIITASMIEREAMVDSERGIISGVIKNRLERDMLLQIDATILYILNMDEKDVVYYADLEVDSPYNTYKYIGLPQAPIACPGRAAIDAALNPQEHDYLYYVSRGDGSHQFTRTYNEHLQAKAQYLD
jgi:UPF0755 protein